MCSQLPCSLDHQDGIWLDLTNRRLLSCEFSADAFTDAPQLSPRTDRDRSSDADASSAAVATADTRCCFHVNQIPYVNDGLSNGSGTIMNGMVFVVSAVASILLMLSNGMRFVDALGNYRDDGIVKGVIFNQQL